MPFNYFEDRYEIQEIIGEGGEGRILKALDKAVDRFVAIKELKLRNKKREEALREARAIARISHPNVVSLYDVIEDEEEIYLIMEYVEGISLRELLQEYHMMDFQTALGIFIQVALAVEFAHNHGILHLDIKPENILVSSSGVVKLTDFGIARFVTEPEDAGKIMGTTHYLAPESLRGKYSVASDVFALGVILYEMLAGENPFYSYSQEEAYKKILEFDPPLISSLRKDVPEEFDQILAKALAKHPGRRFKDVTRFRIKVERFFEYDYPEEPIREIFEQEKSKPPRTITLGKKALRTLTFRTSHALGLASASFMVSFIARDGNLIDSLIFTALVLIVSFLTVPLGGFLIFALSSYIIAKTSIFSSVLLIALGIFLFWLLRDISKEGALAGLALATSPIGIEGALLSILFHKKKLSSIFSGLICYLSLSFLVIFFLNQSNEFLSSSVFLLPLPGKTFAFKFLNLVSVPVVALLVSAGIYRILKGKAKNFSSAISLFLVGAALLSLNQAGYLKEIFSLERLSISLFAAILYGVYDLIRRAPDNI
ncbi:MAG: protein kinase [Actinobacteria bacterium]|nr:protein kinase [Actinomycetota bacterium]